MAASRSSRSSRRRARQPGRIVDRLGIGYYGRVELLERHGKWLHITPKQLAWADRWFERYGGATVFFSRMLPVIRTFISLPAGVARMPFWRFTLLSFAGIVPWVLGFGRSSARGRQRLGQPRRRSSTTPTTRSSPRSSRASSTCWCAAAGGLAAGQAGGRDAPADAWPTRAPAPPCGRAGRGAGPGRAAAGLELRAISCWCPPCWDGPTASSTPSCASRSRSRCTPAARSRS